jgi:5-hydroxyisourate hydrolase
MEAPMPGFLTTHVLDTARGCPAEGLKIALYRVSGNSHRKIAEMVTNADGRTDTPILPEAEFSDRHLRAGVLRRRLPARGRACDALEPLFLDEVPIRFGMAEDDHYHVPLLLSPYGYSTYRGS